MDFSASHHDVQGSRPLCHCLGIPAEEIQTAIADHGLSSVRSVTSVCGAGGGCTSCHRHIKRMLHEHARQRTVEPVHSAAEHCAVEQLLGCA